jgi:hypothetical protein
VNRTKKIVLGAIGLVAIGVAGGAIAATQLDSPSARSAAIVTDAAGQLGVTPAALQNALVKAEEDQIDSEVSSGQISKDQGDALKSALESGALPVINTPGPGGGGGGGFRGGGFGGAGPFTDLSAAASFLGLTVQQIQTDLQNGQTLADIAKAQGKTADDLVSALVTAERSKIDSAVSAGKLSSDQETKILAALQTQITNAVNNTQPTPAAGGGPGFGLGRFGWRGPGGGAFFMGGNIPAAASFLGLTNQQVMSDLQNGRTLADIAKAQGKTVDDLVAALVAAEKSNLDEGVSAGKLSSDQETKILANAQSQITSQVNGTAPGFFGRGPGGPAGHGFHWGGGPPPGPASSGTTTSSTTTTSG